MLKKKLLIWCLELRRSYGGLKGDIQMINWYSNYVFNNNNNKKINKLPSLDVKIKLIDINLISKKDIILEAIDFHCSNILYLLNIKFPEHSIYIIKNDMGM